MRETLDRAPVYKYPDVKVSAYRGKVQLSGFVATEGQKKLADTIASQLPGVDRVENDLLLKKDGVGGSFGP